MMGPQLIWNLKVAERECVAAMESFLAAANDCSAVSPSDPHALQNLKLAKFTQAHALASYKRAVDQFLNLTLGEELEEGPEANAMPLADLLLLSLQSGELKPVEFVQLAGEVPIIELAKLRDALLL